MKKTNNMGPPPEPSASGSGGERRSKRAERTLLLRCKGCIWAEIISEGITFCPFQKCVKGDLTGQRKKERNMPDGETSAGR